MKNYDVTTVLRLLAKKADVIIRGNVITIDRSSKAKKDLGNGSWGKIDFLVNYHNYILK